MVGIHIVTTINRSCIKFYLQPFGGFLIVVTNVVPNSAQENNGTKFHTALPDMAPYPRHYKHFYEPHFLAAGTLTVYRSCHSKHIHCSNMTTTKFHARLILMASSGRASSDTDGDSLTYA